MSSNIFEEEISQIAKVDFIPWESLRDKTVFITGATGLIGRTLVHALYYVSKGKNLNIKVIALVRDLKKAKDRFSDIGDASFLRFVVGTVEEVIQMEDRIDFVIHGASQTTSKEFVEHAVETINTALLGTMNVLKLAKKNAVQGMVYLSSMEVYGFPEKGHKVKETEIGSLSPLDLRNSYPMSKVMCESLCCAYAGEYHIPVSVVRLTQTFGPGVSYNDSRIFGYFLRCINEKKNIVLKTKGETERSYLYTIDAATAILTILLKGEPGHAYNAADEKTYCSISQMAQMVADGAGVSVEYEIEDETKNGFLKTLYMDLDTSKLQKLGWCPVGGGMTLPEMYQRTCHGLNNNADNL